MFYPYFNFSNPLLFTFFTLQGFHNWLWIRRPLFSILNYLVYYLFTADFYFYSWRVLPNFVSPINFYQDSKYVCHPYFSSWYILFAKKSSFPKDIFAVVMKNTSAPSILGACTKNCYPVGCCELSKSTLVAFS